MTSFDPRRPLVIVEAEIHGPRQFIVAQLALDTGATRTMLSNDVHEQIGYDSAQSTTRITVATGSGLVNVPLKKTRKIVTLGQTRRDVQVLAHDLPFGSNIDGLLGLNFMRRQVLTIDFSNGTIELRKP